MAKKNDTLTETKRKNRARRRFWILFVIWFMAFGVLAGIIGANWPNETFRIVMMVIVGVLTVAYWLGFYIIFRRERQKEEGKK
jgi:quinol-cytochrome oxidoreductase complex cytochrome b subunit